MRLVQLDISHLRNLSQVRLLPGPGINLIYGANGSGKTTLLEAIYILGRAKTFRSLYLRRAVSHGEASFTLFGRMVDSQGHPTPIGLELQEGKCRLRIANAAAQKSSELAKFLPLLLITPESHRFISSGPYERRLFLDWGVFHVEQRFLPAWQRYQRALKQRNASLRQAQGHEGMARAWDSELSEMATQLDDYRSDYMAKFVPIAQDYAEKLLDNPGLALHYQRGWPQEKDLRALLSSSWAEDRAQGYTCYGPHRADLRIYFHGRAARETCSRGEQKLLICALFLAQAALFKAITQQQCLFLIDDLASELDPYHRSTFLALLQDIGAQTFITATDLGFFDPAFLAQTRMFHVEHGKLSSRAVAVVNPEPA